MTNVTVRMSRFLLPAAFKGSNHLTTQLLGQNCANLRTAASVIVIRGSHTSHLLHQQSHGHLSTAPSLLLQQISHKQHFHSTSSWFQDSKSAGSEVPKDKVAQLKLAVKHYGPTVIVFHVGISLMSLGFFYTIVSSGLDVVGLVSRLPYLGDHLKESAVAAGATTFVMSYAVHKVFAPVRIGITLTSAPFLVNYLRSKGILKVKKT